MTDQADLLPGTLDLLILKAVSLGDVHGYGSSAFPDPQHRRRSTGLGSVVGSAGVARVSLEAVEPSSIWAIERTRDLGRPYVRLDCESDRERPRTGYKCFGFGHYSDRQVGPSVVARHEYQIGDG